MRPNYPDGQTAATAQNGNYFTAVSQTLAPGTTTGTVKPCGSFSSLSLVIVPTAGTAKVTPSAAAVRRRVRTCSVDPVATAATASAVRTSPVTRWRRAIRGLGGPTPPRAVPAAGHPRHQIKP